MMEPVAVSDVASPSSKALLFWLVSCRVKVFFAGPYTSLSVMGMRMVPEPPFAGMENIL